MHLYHLTLSPPPCLFQSIAGHFSGSSKSQEILCASNTHLTLLRADPLSGKILTLCVQPLFSTVRSLSTFRLPGSVQEYAVVGSDSGRIVVLEYQSSTNKLVQVHMETFGKTGMRRLVPGQYLAADPKGRALMIGIS